VKTRRIRTQAHSFLFFLILQKILQLTIRILTPISNAVKWAEDSGYELLSIDREYKTSPEIQHSDLTHLPSNLKFALALEGSSIFGDLIRIRANDVYIIVWNWQTNKGTNSYKYFIISSNGNLFCEPPAHSEVWLKYFPSLFYLKDGIVGLEESILKNAELIIPKVKTLVIGGFPHFGHWIADTLPQIITALSEDEDFDLFATELTAYQANVLKDLLGSYDFGKRHASLIQPNVGRDRFKVYRFTDAYIYAGLSVRAKNSLLRSTLGSDNINNLSMYQGSDSWTHAVYLYRGCVNGVERVSNERDLVTLFQAEGIAVVDSASLTFKQARRLFSNYRYFISALGSGNTNFNIFGERNSRLIQLLPQSFQRLSSEISLGSAIYMTPRIANTDFIICEQVEPESYSEHGSIIIRQHLIDEIIRRVGSQHNRAENPQNHSPSVELR
jgi:hypothetical protein